MHSPRKRAGQSSVRQIAADAPKLVWALDFQFDSTVDGKAIKIASMLDEHTRVSLLNIVERSITSARLIEELEKAFAVWGDHRWCCGWTTARSSFRIRCNSIAQERSE